MNGLSVTTELLCANNLRHLRATVQSLTNSVKKVIPKAAERVVRDFEDVLMLSCRSYYKRYFRETKILTDLEYRKVMNYYTQIVKFEQLA